VFREGAEHCTRGACAPLRKSACIGSFVLIREIRVNPSASVVENRLRVEGGYFQRDPVEIIGIWGNIESLA